jgi:hypothetical protein
MKEKNLSSASEVSQKKEVKERIRATLKAEKANGFGKYIVKFGPELVQKDVSMGWSAMDLHMDDLLKSLELKRGDMEKIANALIEIIDVQIIKDENKLLKLGVELGRNNQ